ncbi:LysR family transcriptional regulator [Crenobacter caeni]|uniref:LysR family transcriptional regulator n=1 Tax=Crenobacter caeni TaxID=2705474 RepID=A0A6B2KP22_9NEIS|nr:LysR family transcriptional regulator [Crenobacter caeni]NDV11821.1 LysR family transcriptional regulator [Crenobacter caeni]
MLNIDALTAFCAVIDAGSFSAAAERLGQTPSGISRTISRLESQLGISLITRTTRRLDLTEEGRWLLERARAILAELAETEAQLANSLGQPSGLVRVNAATPVLAHLIAPLVAGFLDAYPQVQLELTHGETVVDLIEERADVAIRLGTLADSTLNARRLGETALRLVAAPAYLARHGTPASVDALAAHRLLGFTQPVSLNLWPLRHAGGDGLAIRPSLAASSGETLYRLALEGAGIACLSDFLVADALAQGKLCEVLPAARLDWSLPVWAVFYRQGTLAPRLAAFVDYLAAHLAARLGAGKGR